MEGEVLEVPQFIPSLHKSTQQFGFSFAHDAPKVWNELLDDTHSVTFPLSFRKAESLSPHKSQTTLGFITFSDCLSGVDPPTSVSLDYDSLELFLGCWILESIF